MRKFILLGLVASIGILQVSAQKPVIYQKDVTTLTGLRSVTTYAMKDSVTIDFSKSRLQTLTLTDSVVFKGTKYFVGAELAVRVVGYGTIATVAFPAGWKFIGAAAPTTLAASKTAVLKLYSYGSTAANVIARWEVQP